MANENRPIIEERMHGVSVGTDAQGRIVVTLATDDRSRLTSKGDRVSCASTGGNLRLRVGGEVFNLNLNLTAARPGQPVPSK